LCQLDSYNFTCSGNGGSDGRFSTNTTEIMGRVLVKMAGSQTLKRVGANGRITGIKTDDDIRAYSADVISRTCFFLRTRLSAYFIKKVAVTNRS
jgi:hypothetical protein